MNPFQLTRASSAAQASQLASTSKTSQQGADVRFVAGGTTLIDLMKLNVEQPKTVSTLTAWDWKRSRRSRMVR